VNDSLYSNHTKLLNPTNVLPEPGYVNVNRSRFKDRHAIKELPIDNGLSLP